MAIAEGSSHPALVAELRQVHRSRQLLLLRGVLERAEELVEVTGPLPSLSDGWALLAEVQHRDPAVVDSIIMLPWTGVWTKGVLRLLDEEEHPGRPLWTELGYFHLMVAAAAIRAGFPFAWQVPVWRGTLMLPTLGLATIPGDEEWSVAELRYDSGKISVYGMNGGADLPGDLLSDAPNWAPLRVLRMGDRSVWLDDIDPHREFGAPMPPRRLSEAEVTTWASALRETWLLLSEHHPAIAGELAEGLSTLVPHAATESTGLYSGSHNDGFGSVVLSRPPDATTFAELLVHEFGHSKFGVLLSGIDLLDPDGDNDIPRLYAPWRDDPRPPIGVLHGVYSFLAVTAFYRAHGAVVSGRSARAAQFEFEFHRIRTILGIESLLAATELTELGRLFLDTALARLHSWASEPLPTDVREAAQCSNLDNRLCWRIRHLRPDSASVTTLADAWEAGGTKPVVGTEVSLEPAVGSVPKPRLALTRTWLSNPERVERYRTELDLLAAEIGWATPADLALLDGDIDQATRLFREQVRARPESPTDWAGLAVASGEKAFVTHPELVFRVHQEIRVRTGEVVDPVRVAAWLG